MQILDLQPIPNQKFSVTLDNDNYDISIYCISDNNDMAIDITINGNLTISGLKIVPNQVLIPYAYLVTGGNFIFSTINDELITYDNFGGSQILYYITAAELNG